MVRTVFNFSPQQSDVPCRSNRMIARIIVGAALLSLHMPIDSTSAQSQPEELTRTIFASTGSQRR